MGGEHSGLLSPYCNQLNVFQNEHPFIYDMSLNQIVSTNIFQEGLNLMITPFHDYPRWRKELITNEIQVYGIIIFSKITSFYVKIIVNKSKCSMIDLSTNQWGVI